MSGRNPPSQGSARRNTPTASASTTTPSARQPATPAKQIPHRPAGTANSASASRGAAENPGARTNNARPTPKPRWADLAKPVPPLPLDTPFIQGAIAGLDLQKKQASLGNTIRVQELHKQYERHADNVLVVVTSQNQHECDLLFSAVNAHKPNKACLVRIDNPGWSGVGDQAYEGAGAVGAHNRVFSALGTLFVMPMYVRFLKEKKIGTVIVGAVENFIVRPRAAAGVDPATKELVTNCPVDWGFVAFCRVRLAADPAFKWTTAVTQGAPVPLNHIFTAATAGFENEQKTFGKVSIGKVIGEKGLKNEKGWDEADWQVRLIGKSWYDMLLDALAKVRIPWS